MEIIQADLIQMAKNQQFDVLVHGCNIYCTFGKGLAKKIKEHFPTAYEADKKTAYGDVNKVGTYSQVHIPEYHLTIVNAYTQKRLSRDGKDVFEYQGFYHILRQLKQEMGHQKIAFPLIGCGLARGDMKTILGMIQEEMNGCDYILVENQPKMVAQAQKVLREITG